MRKRNFAYYIDLVFWYLMYFLPIIMYLAYIIDRDGSTLLAFTAFLGQLGFINGPMTDIVSTSLNSIFGSSGVLPFFTSNVIFMMSWFVNMFILHLMVDFLLFIPRLAHKWLDHFCKCD